MQSQERGDYLIKINGDTIFTRFIRIDKKMKYVVSDSAGKLTRYDVREVLELKYDTVVYESGFARIKSPGEFLFLKRIIKGELSLYEAKVKKTKILWKNFGEDLIHLRWVYRAQDWSKKYTVPVYFYRRLSETGRNFSKSWKEKTADCLLFTDKIRSKTRLWDPTERELVEYYNAQCK
jgi:hypothetical protein